MIKCIINYHKRYRVNKLSIAIDMGAKNNGVFIVKSDNEGIVEKKASCIVIDGNAINFSKKSRRENRHKDRNYKRRKLAKRLLRELVDISTYDEKQQENIMGLLNNRGYTFLSSTTEFEQLADESLEFVKKYLPKLGEYQTKDEFEVFLTDAFEDEEKLKEFIEEQSHLITQYSSDLKNYTDKKKILEDLKSLQSKEIIKLKAPTYTKLTNYT